jgi:hypothetical protein
MASYTTNLNLKKPAGSENVAIGDINGNMDTIDTAFGVLNSNISTKTQDIYNNGDVIAYKSGNVVFVCITYGTYKCTEANGEVLTNAGASFALPSGWRPANSVRATEYSYKYSMYVKTDGTIHSLETFSNSAIRVTFTYVTP